MFNPVNEAWNTLNVPSLRSKTPPKIGALDMYEMLKLNLWRPGIYEESQRYHYYNGHTETVW